jgi:hypothetical protein
LIFILFAVQNYNNKREFFYVIILILFVEFVKKGVNIKAKFNFFLVFVACSIGILYSVATASILRGYGNYDTDNPVKAFLYVNDYLSSDVIPSLVNNFELNVVYGNGSNAVNYVYSGEMKLLYGSTFTKVLFIPIPRNIFPDKPYSMIDIYTKKYRPNLRNDGGSLPINVYSEAFWNFTLFALPFIYLIFYFINRLYLNMILQLKRCNFSLSFLFVLYCYITIIQFVRGSGFEIWILYPILSVPFLWIFAKYLKTEE